MIKLVVHRPKGHVVARTQAYRIKIRAELASRGSSSSSSSSSSEHEHQQPTLTDAKVFVVREDGFGFEHLQGVAEPYDLEELDDDTNPRRTDEIDCWLPSPEIANDMLDSLVTDIQNLIESFLGVKTVIELSGGTV